MWKVFSHRYQDIDKDLFLRPQDIPTKKMAGSKEEKKKIRPHGKIRETASHQFSMRC